MKLLPLIITLVILLAPDLALAQGNITPDGLYTGGGLIPCGQTAANACNSCHVVILANTIIKWLIGITFMIFAGMAVYAGVKLVMSGGNSHAKEDAKQMFTNVFIGLMIILGAWLMVDTLLRFVLKNGETGNIDGYGPWSQVKCVSETESKTTKMTIDESEFEPADPSDTTTYSGAPTAGGAGNNCTPIPDSQLVAFPASVTNGSTERALQDTVNRFVSMRAAAAKDGIDLKVSDGYRSPQEQLSAWNGNGCRLVNGKASCATRTAAVPCSLGGNGSNHTSGKAVDITLTNGAYTWLKANGGKYGFNNQLANDKPHWSPTGR